MGKKYEELISRFMIATDFIKKSKEMTKNIFDHIEIYMIDRNRELFNLIESLTEEDYKYILTTVYGRYLTYEELEKVVDWQETEIGMKMNSLSLTFVDQTNDMVMDIINKRLKQ